MQMDVKDRLSSITVAVDHRAVAAGVVAPVSRDRCRPARQLAHQRVVCSRHLVERRNVPLRNHHDMQRRLRIDVLERQQVFVFMHTFRGNFSGDDFAE
jgi:hypothetical protein